MFRQGSTLLVLATLLTLGACTDEIVADAIPVKDASSDPISEAFKEGSAADSAHHEGATADAPDALESEEVANRVEAAPDAGADGSVADEGTAVFDTTPE